jgi:DNA-binding transcriptional LysR family regulator
MRSTRFLIFCSLLFPMIDADLSYFKQIAESGSLAKAGEALGMSQSALSRAVQRLEKRFRLALFERTARGVALTSAGARLLVRVHEADLALSAAQTELNEIAGGNAGRVRVAVGQTILSAVVRALVPRLRTERPAAQLRIDAWFNDEILARVAQGEYDFGVCVVPASLSEALHSKIVTHDFFVPVVRNDHPLAKKARIQAAELMAFPWIGAGRRQASFTALQVLIEEAGFTLPKNMLESNSYDSVLTALHASDAITFAPRWLIQAQQGLFSGLVALPVPKLTLRRPLGFVWRKGGYLAPVTERAMALAEEALIKNTFTRNGLVKNE